MAQHPTKERGSPASLAMEIGSVIAVGTVVVSNDIADSVIATVKNKIELAKVAWENFETIRDGINALADPIETMKREATSVVFATMEAATAIQESIEGATHQTGLAIADLTQQFAREIDNIITPATSSVVLRPPGEHGALEGFADTEPFQVQRRVNELMRNVEFSSLTPSNNEEIPNLFSVISKYLVGTESVLAEMSNDGIMDAVTTAPSIVDSDNESKVAQGICTQTEHQPCFSDPTSKSYSSLTLAIDSGSLKSPLPETYKLSDRLDLAHKMFPEGSAKNIDRYLHHIEDALKARGIDDNDMFLVALSTVRAETEGFLPIGEFKSKYNTLREPFDQYEPETRLGHKLGNELEGDGARYKGRGFIQLTGRYNYQEIGTKIGVNLEENPELANDPKNASDILAEYLRKHEVRIRQALEDRNLDQVRKIVNGGTHGNLKFKDAMGRGLAYLAESSTTRIA